MLVAIDLHRIFSHTIKVNGYRQLFGYQRSSKHLSVCVCGVVWCGVVWCSVCVCVCVCVWCGVVWCGVCVCVCVCVQQKKETHTDLEQVEDD